MSEEEKKEVLIGFLIGSVSILRDMNIQLTEKSRNKLADRMGSLLLAYEKEKEKNKKALDFINDKNNYFEDGENWQNVLKIKEILEE